MWKEKAIFFIVIVCFLVFIIFFGCHSKDETLKINIDLDYNETKSSSILFETKPGCSKTNFKFTEKFHEEIEFEDYNSFILSDFIQYESTIKRYFEMDFFNTITQEYFETKNLVILLLNHLHDGDYLKNDKIKENNNKYIFEAEVWSNTALILFRNKCLYTKVIILEIEK